MNKIKQHNNIVTNLYADIVIKHRFGERAYNLVINQSKYAKNLKNALNYYTYEFDKLSLKAQKNKNILIKYIKQAYKLFKTKHKYEQNYNNHRLTFKKVELFKSNKIKKLNKIKNELHNLLISKYRTEHLNIKHSKSNFDIYNDTETDWDYYSKRCKYPKIQHTCNIYIDLTGWSKLKHKTCNNLVNVTCKHYHTYVDSVVIYKACWIKQKQGYNHEFVDGYIAMIDDVSYHSDTVIKAHNGILRKVKIANNVSNYFTFNPSSFVDKCDNLTLSVKDVEKAGGCIPGIIQFKNRHNLNSNIIKLKLAIKLYIKDPQSELKLAIFKKLKKQIGETQNV